MKGIAHCCLEPACFSEHQLVTGEVSILRYFLQGFGSVSQCSEEYCRVGHVSEVHSDSS